MALTLTLSEKQGRVGFRPFGGGGCPCASTGVQEVSSNGVLTCCGGVVTEMFHCATRSLSWSDEYLLPMSDAPDSVSVVLSSDRKCHGGGGRCTDGMDRAGIRRTPPLRSSDWRKLRTEGRTAPLLELSNHNRQRCCRPLPLGLRSPPDCRWRFKSGLFKGTCSRHSGDWTIHVQSVDACTKVSPSLIGPSDLRSFPRQR